MSKDVENLIEFDWRIGFSICFYVLLAFIHGTLGSVEQKPGLRLSMGLGIVFCMTEVRLLSDVASQIDFGFAPDPKLAQLMGVFPPNWCTFEIIQVMRIVYFFAFSCICAFSVVFVEDEIKVKLEKSLEVVRNMGFIRLKCYRIYEKTVRFADVTPEEREELEKMRLENPELPEEDSQTPERMMIDL